MTLNHMTKQRTSAADRQRFQLSRIVALGLTTKIRIRNTLCILKETLFHQLCKFPTLTNPLIQQNQNKTPFSDWNVISKVSQVQTHISWPMHINQPVRTTNPKNSCELYKTWDLIKIFFYSSSYEEQFIWCGLERYERYVAYAEWPHHPVRSMIKRITQDWERALDFR